MVAGVLPAAHLCVVCRGVGLLLLVLALRVQATPHATASTTAIPRTMSDSEEEAKEVLARRRARDAARQAKYREKNRDKILEVRKRYRETHQEKQREYQRQYGETHRTQLAEIQKRYRERHRARVAESKKRYRDTHREQYREYKRQYRANQRKRQKEKKRTLEKVKALGPLKLTVTLTDVLKSPSGGTPVTTYFTSFCQSLEAEDRPQPSVETCWNDFVDSVESFYELLEDESWTLTNLDSGDIQTVEPPVWDQWLDDLMEDLSSLKDCV